MFLSNLINTGPLIACGVTLLFAAIAYGKIIIVVTHVRILNNNTIGIAAFTGQAFASSK
jgi:hypothetical protein